MKKFLAILMRLYDFNNFIIKIGVGSDEESALADLRAKIIGEVVDDGTTGPRTFTVTDWKTVVLYEEPPEDLPGWKAFDLTYEIHEIEV